MPDTPRPRPVRRAARSAATVEFEPLVPQPAYGRVAAAIEQRILERRLRPGDQLPTEADLARQFGVNRSTVREALRRLESGGLVGRDAGAKRLRVTRPGHADTASRVSRALALDEVTFIELWEAMLAVADRTASLVITGSGDVLEPEFGIVAIGSGGPYAQAAARALVENTPLPARDVVQRSLDIAGDLCIYTNRNLTIESLEWSA